MYFNFTNLFVDKLVIIHCVRSNVVTTRLFSIDGCCRLLLELALHARSCSCSYFTGNHIRLMVCAIYEIAFKCSSFNGEDVASPSHFHALRPPAIFNAPNHWQTNKILPQGSCRTHVNFSTNKTQKNPPNRRVELGISRAVVRHLSNELITLTVLYDLSNEAIIDRDLCDTLRLLSIVIFSVKSRKSRRKCLYFHSGFLTFAKAERVFVNYFIFVAVRPCLRGRNTCGRIINVI